MNSLADVLHRIRVKLYPNYLPQTEGAYIARTDNEAMLTIEEVCAALKNRGGFTGNYDDLVEHVNQYLDEVAYQICDGYAVNTGYFSIHPNVGGTFDKPTEGHDAKKHPITFRFLTRASLRALVEHIVVDIEGLADVQGYIDEFLDVKTGAVNETLTPDGQFVISGHKIKIAGDAPEVGVYFEADDGVQIKMMDALAVNSASSLVGVAPILASRTWKVVVKTQYTVGGTLLKAPRDIVSRFTLTS
jgi:hypothetical protein